MAFQTGCSSAALHEEWGISDAKIFTGKVPAAIRDKLLELGEKLARTGRP
jgi:hypothetical protein